MTLYKLWSSRKPTLDVDNFSAETDKIYFDSDAGIFYVGDDNEVPVPLTSAGQGSFIIATISFDTIGMQFTVLPSEHRFSEVLSVHLCDMHDNIKSVVIKIEDDNTIYLDSIVDLVNHRLIIKGVLNR